MPQCFICMEIFNSQLNLLRHISQYRSSNNIDSLQILELECYRVFSSFNSFRKHLKTHNIPCNDALVTIEPQEPIVNSELNNISVDSSELTVETFNEVVTEGAVQLISKWYNEAGIPRNKVQDLINDIKLINLNSIHILQNEVLNNLKTNENNPNTISKISTMFDILKNPFKDLETEYVRLNTLE